MATPEEILAKAKELADAGDMEGAKRLAKIAKARMPGSVIGPDGMTNAERIKAVKAGTLPQPSAERLAEQAEIDQNAADRVTLEGSGNALNYLTKFNQGIPFIGEYADEFTGAVGNALGYITGDDGLGDRAMGQQRAVMAAMDRQQPIASGALQIGGGIAGAIPLAAAAAPMLIGSAPATLAGKVLAAGATGAVAGGTEGFISGYGAGEGDNRMRTAMDRGVIGAGLGGALGGLVPAAGAGIRRAMEYLKGKDLSVISKTLGISEDAARMIKPSVDALDFDAAMATLQKVGDDAMLADAGVSTRRALDYAITGGGKAARVGIDAVTDRAEKAGARLTRVMDMILGAPTGIKATMRSIAKRTAPALAKAYNKAYSTAINYADDAGRKIEGVLERIHPDILNAAIKEANEAMRADGVRNMQIMAMIDDAGEVVFREMPNVQQLDEIKKGLDAIVRAETDAVTGKISTRGRRASMLAGDLRNAIAEAVPAYKVALKLGGDKAATETALDTGRKLFTPGMTRERVAEVMSGGSPAKVEPGSVVPYGAAAPLDVKDAIRKGIREYIDDTLARVRRAYDNPDADVAETIKLLSTLSSRDAREKLVMAIGEGKADRLLKEIDAAGKMFGTRQAIAAGSQTAQRLALDEQMSGILAPGVVGNAAQGKGFGTVQSFVQFLTRATPEADMARKQEVLADVARALTQMRGKDAESALVLVRKAVEGQPLKTEEAVRIARLVSGSAALVGYQTGTKSLAPQ